MQLEVVLELALIFRDDLVVVGVVVWEEVVEDFRLEIELVGTLMVVVLVDVDVRELTVCK